MKIDVGMTMLVCRDVVRFEMRDNDSRVSFVRVEITPEAFMKMLSSQSDVLVEGVELHGLDKLGKVMENKSFEFQIPDGAGYDERKGVAERYALAACPKGWKPDLHFGSQNSFFTADSGESMARCTIRRWVEKTKEKGAENAD